mmetsp:Transcript_3402/g.4788  ORF Transcript_3402/g.4788 Transcript_3402/m.4788 type:complete len:376 (+) Transcript_3402:170-1297(+)
MGQVLSTIWGSGEKVKVVVIGCGVPERGMGWYHAKQLLDGDIPSGSLHAVVEPWFLGPGADSEPGKAFAAWKEEVETNGNTTFHSSVDSVEFDDKTLALISGRTADNPKLLRAVVDKGCKCVYLEKPGAPSVKELEGMSKYAADNDVKVFMGYNKNVTKYVKQALDIQGKMPGSQTTFIHNNAYKPEELPECFERNAEGMFKNFVVHELALLVTYYNVSVDNIKSVEFDDEFCSVQTLGKFTDFDKVKFTLTTKEDISVTVQADRCGGSFSNAVVYLDGEEQFRSVTPDDALQRVVESKQAKFPGYMPYFFLQHDDYITLKQSVCNNMVTGAEATGIATIEIAIETLKVAEHLTHAGMKKYSPGFFAKLIEQINI